MAAHDLDEVFSWRRRDHSGTKPCPNCGHPIPQPTSDPWCVFDGIAMPPEAVFLLCEGCGEEVQFSLEDIDPTIPPEQ